MKILWILSSFYVVVGLLNGASASANGSRADMVYAVLKADPDDPEWYPDWESGFKFGSPCFPEDAPDNCGWATTLTMVINHGTADKRATVVSDIAEALVCVPDPEDPTIGKCGCAEKGSFVQMLGTRKLCLKQLGSLKAGEECIRTAECGAKLVCVIDANMPGSEDIEDTRRYCSDSSKMIPVTLLFIVATLFYINLFF